MQNNFYLPFMGKDTIKLIYILREQLIQYQNYLKFPEANIIGVYGSFNNIIWNGGRPITTTDFNTFDDVKKCINDLNNNNLICKFTFTNQLLKKEHCQDRYSNQVLELINETNNEITINSPILENYIREHYPNIKLTSSITKGFDLNTLKEVLQQDYKNVVCYYKTDILKYLETETMENQQKIELLLGGDPCANCPLYHKHYEIISYYNLYNIYKEHECIRENPNYILNEKNNLLFDISYFSSLNIHTYKIQGRLLSIEQLIDKYVRIFFLPEIQEKIKNNIRREYEIF